MAIGSLDDAVVFNGERLLRFDISKQRIRRTQADAPPAHANGGALSISDGQSLIEGISGQASDISPSFGGISGGDADLDETLTRTASSSRTPEAFRMMATTLNKGPDEATKIFATISAPRIFAVESPPKGCSFGSGKRDCNDDSRDAKRKIAANSNFFPLQAGRA